MKAIGWILVMALACLFLERSVNAQGKKGPLEVCLVAAVGEYEPDVSLAAFQKYLEKHYNAKCTRAFGQDVIKLPGLENLDTCDVMVLFTRRLQIQGEQLERVKKYCLAGKPIVGIRTASHAFQNWLDLDREVFGGNYKNHYPAGPLTEIEVTTKGKKHPILADFKPFKSVGSLYKNTGLAEDTEVLLTGSNPGKSEPIAWTRNYKGARVFYTSLGHQKDFEEEDFLQLLTNALYWTTNRVPVKK